MNSSTRIWRAVFWVLWLGWAIGAVLHMAHVKGGFLTSYLADIAFPPWFYIYLRGLHREDAQQARLVGVGQWFGQRPVWAAIGIWVVGFITEVKTLYWPTGTITGVYDVWDIAAYSVGILICWALDPKGGRLLLTER